MPNEKTRIDLADANHVLFHNGVVDAFGHVSARSPTDPDRFLLSRNMAPALVTPDDICEFDRDGALVGGGDTKVYLERFIHAAIYRARPDVGAVVHSHAHTLIPFGATDQPLRPIWHMSGFIADSAPVFEIRDFAGEDSNMLITGNALGDDLARVLGSAAVVLMRGHGGTVVGDTVQQAVFRAIYAQLNAGIQMAAHQLGPVTFLNTAEAANADAANAGQVLRAWELWVRQARNDPQR